MTLSEGRHLGFALHCGTRAERDRVRMWSQHEIDGRLDDTIAAWDSWSELHQSYEGPWRDLVDQSGRVLQALSFRPTGAICAAATTSLPETVGGDRNWDYRYSWVRDASFTIEALWVAACPDEVNEFFDFMTTTSATVGRTRQRPADHVRHRRRARPHRTRAARISRAGAGARRCASATARGTNGSSTCTARSSTASTDSPTRSPTSRPARSRSSSTWPTPPRSAGRNPIRGSGRYAARPASSCTRS